MTRRYIVLLNLNEDVNFRKAASIVTEYCMKEELDTRIIARLRILKTLIVESDPDDVMELKNLDVVKTVAPDF